MGKTLQELGYGFNKEGQLRKLNEEGEPGDEPFKFKISHNLDKCQKHYDAVAEAITEDIYRILETQENLIRLRVPKDFAEDSSTFIFASKDYEKKDTLLILIHGSGAVRAGQWSRRVIMNNGLDKGSQIPEIKKASEKGIIILNTNHNTTDTGDYIQGSSSPEEHGRYVWRYYVAETEAKNIVIIAHSYGGIVVSKIAESETEDFKKRVKAVALTDALVAISDESIMEFFKQISKNWVTSNRPLDAVITDKEDSITRVSAGHLKHTMTPYSARESVFKFIESKLQDIK